MPQGPLGIALSCWEAHIEIATIKILCTQWDRNQELQERGKFKTQKQKKTTQTNILKTVSKACRINTMVFIWGNESLMITENASYATS